MKYFQVLYFFLQYFFHHLEIRHLGCGLRHQASLFHWGQHLGILYPLQDMYLAFFPIAGDPLHLWVIRRAKEQDRPVCLRLLPYDLMDPGTKGQVASSTLPARLSKATRFLGERPWDRITAVAPWGISSRVFTA